MTHVPMESAGKCRRLMTVGHLSGESLWLDALSIDQSDPEDVAARMAIMGDIYSRARSLAVLFPTSNGKALKLLERLGELAIFICERKAEFQKKIPKLNRWTRNVRSSLL